jgi:hypothetical protein
MKENGLAVRPRRRFIAATYSDHDGPSLPNLAKNIVPTNWNQLWVADITYIAIATGFVYLAAILDAWSRRVVGYAVGKRIDAPSRHRGTPTASRVHPPLRPRFAVRFCRGLSSRARQARPQSRSPELEVARQPARKSGHGRG